MITEIVGIVVAVIVLLDAISGFKLTRAIFNRGRKTVSDLAENARDPIAEAELTIEDVQTLRRTVIQQIELAKQAKLKAQNDVDKFERLAIAAGKSKNAEDVRIALEKKAAAKSELTLAETNIARFSQQEDNLEKQIANCDVNITKAKTNTKFLSAELKHNQFVTKINDTLVDNSGATNSALNRLEKDVEEARANAVASNQIAYESKGLEEKYSSDGNVTDEDISQYLK